MSFPTRYTEAAKTRIREYYERQLRLIESGEFFKETPVRKPRDTRHSTLIWKHNSFLGFARMTEVHMSAIIDSLTATDEAKSLAESIRLNALALKAALSERKELP